MMDISKLGSLFSAMAKHDEAEEQEMASPP